MTFMEKVICTECGSIGYTASPEHVSCECGGKHKAITVGYKDLQRHKHNRILPLFGTKAG